MEKKFTNAILKIAIVGPESTGKSSMANYLANKFETIWVKEFAREYCENLKKDCTLEDEMNMFHGQLKLENSALLQIQKSKFSNLLFCDTTIITVKIWCEHVFGFCPEIVQQEFSNRKYDLYLLMKDDIPWVDDPLRNFPNERHYFFNRYEYLLNELNANYRIISGEGLIREENAKKEVEKFILSLAV